MSVAPASRRSHRITLRFLATPADTAAAGRSVAAGSVMEWIDKAGYACAVGWAGTYCVTAYVGNVRHRRPIPPGSIIEAQARIIHTGRTSMHVLTTVSFADVEDGRYQPATTCILVFVAKGADGRPAAVPEWRPESESDHALADMALDRIPARAAIKDLMLDGEDDADDGDSGAPSAVLRFLVPPSVVNFGGNAHGGTVMRWIDEAAYACAASWVRDGDGSSGAVAVYSGGIHFFAPVRIGDLVEVEARLLLTTPHSMHLGIRVTSADPRRPLERRLTTQCMSVFVVPGEHGAHDVPPWTPTHESDHARRRRVQEIVALRQGIVPISATLALRE